MLWLLDPLMAVSRYNANLWLQRGYYIRPVHFYEPMPDVRMLEKHYPAPSSMSGVEMRVEAQLAMLREVFPLYREALAALPAQPNPVDKSAFYLNQSYFCGIDPLVYYGIIRHFKPARIVEVGAGFSTMLAALALRQNETGRLTSIEPYPNEVIAAGIPGVEHVQAKGEDVDVTVFTSLAANDILFIDSSHVVRIGGDVVFLMLEILPRLQPGVLIHIHDIFLPYDYPKGFVLERYRFWTEQYLVQAFLVDNDKIEVVFAANLMCVDHQEAVKAAFPMALDWTGGSLWLRKR
ncbi:MAG: class I SAM-dependent methyltransferase [bacterium]|nr:class I SAM-dependent methyltransferase [bacterium]